MTLGCGDPGDLDYSDKLTDIYSAGVTRMAARLTNGDITLDDWHSQMKDVIEGMFAHQAMAAVNGDRSMISDTNQARMKRDIVDQYGYLDGFADDIQTALDANKSLDFVANRAAMYAKSSQSEYWRQATGEADLPAVPKDGTSECKVNCGCYWECRDGQWYWIRGKDDSCETCIEREQNWSPYEPGS